MPMGNPSCTNPPRPFRWPGLASALLALLISLASAAYAQVITQATSYPLQLPAGLAFDASGNLFIAQPTAHVILRVTPAGAMTTYAGNGIQGFAGDNGPAAAARLDSPTGLAISPSGDLYLSDPHAARIRRIAARTGMMTTFAGTGVAGFSPDGTAAAIAQLNGPTALAFDAAGDLFFADTRNHRVRRIDAANGTVTTVAGNGSQGFAGDGGPALAASLDSPTGLAVDAAGDLLLADSHNQRIRRVDAATHVIQTLAGTGSAGFSGDGGPATTATLHLPQGMTLDAAGNVYFTDSANHRVRRIDAATGQITTVAGQGTQTFAGDNGPAPAASLDSPAAVVLSAASLPTLADTSNLRVRQIDATGVIHTIAGLGTTNGATLTLVAPSTIAYGSGTLTATLAASPATGSVTFFDLTSGTPVTLGSVALSTNAAVLSTATLAAGAHRLQATYAGDTIHSAAESTVLPLQINPAALTVVPASVSLVYGQAVPALSGLLSGLLPQDALAVTLVLASAASSSSAPGSYPISATLTGPAAGNYTLSAAPAAVSIGQAASAITLTPDAAGTTFAVHVSSSTTGKPTGAVRLLDGSALIASSGLSASDDATLSPAAALALGTHTLTAVYAGDMDFLASTSAPAVVSIGTVTLPDFTLAGTGQTSVTVTAGSSASFGFAVAPVNGALSSSIQLNAAGLPPGATASFNPAFLPPGGTISAFVLTIATAKASLEPGVRSFWWAWLLLPLPLAFRRRIRQRLAVLFVLGVLGGLAGCGDRTNLGTTAAAASKSYTITVTGTATGSNGAVLTHSAAVTLVVQ